MRDFQRDRISAFLVRALENANRGNERLAIYEAEAQATNSYQRLVTYLLDEKKYDAAKQWACEGIEQTHAKFPGIAAGLAQSLCELARRRKQWDIVAVHAAVEFLKHPSAEGFQTLIEAAEKAGCQDAVRTAAHAFLETGLAPIRLVRDAKGRHSVSIEPAWPLPVPDYLMSPLTAALSRSASGPHFDVLLEMALADKRLDDVIHWYDKLIATRRGANRKWAGWGVSVDSDRVAKAIARAYPERALEIYQQKLDAHLPQTGTSAYEVCAQCLRNMQSIYKSQDREDYWSELVADIRERFHNRPRFMEILDKLEGRTILQTRRKVSRG
jgi:uncharacterized Zn finger protein